MPILAYTCTGLQQGKPMTVTILCRSKAEQQPQHTHWSPLEEAQDSHYPVQQVLIFAYGPLASPPPGSRFLQVPGNEVGVDRPLNTGSGLNSPFLGSAQKSGQSCLGSPPTSALHRSVGPHTQTTPSASASPYGMAWSPFLATATQDYVAPRAHSRCSTDAPPSCMQ